MGFAIFGLLGLALLSSGLFGDDGDDTDTTVTTDAEDPDTTTVTVDQEPPPTPTTPGVVTNGTETADLLEGTSGNDGLFAKGGDDALIGGDGDDRLFGAAGLDRILGQAGDDFIRGGPDDDFILSGTGMDDVFGDAGDDIIVAVDTVNETAFINAIKGTGPTDLTLDDLYDLDAETREGDVVNGGRGDDMMLLGSNDVATGGQGSDQFDVGYWVNGGEPVTITDFDTEEDTIIYYFQQGTDPDLDTEDDGNGNALLTSGGETVAIVEGISANQLRSSAVFIDEEFD